MLFYTSEGKQYGPTPTIKIIAMIRSGKLKAHDKIRHVDSDEWMCVEEAITLISPDEPTPSSARAVSQPSEKLSDQKTLKGIGAIAYGIKGVFFLALSLVCSYGGYQLSKDAIDIASSGITTTGTVLSSEFHSQRKRRRVDREYWVEISFDNQRKTFHLQDVLQPGSTVGVVYPAGKPDKAVISDEPPSLLSSLRGLGYTPLIAFFMFLGFLIYSFSLFREAKKIMSS